MFMLQPKALIEGVIYPEKDCVLVNTHVSEPT